MITFYAWLLEKLGIKREYVKKWNEDDKQILVLDKYSSNYELSALLSGASFLVIISFFIAGAVNANDKDSCKFKRIGEITTLAPYALGCYLFKERFDYKLN